MNNRFQKLLSLLITVAVALITHPIQSDVIPAACSVEVDCIGRLPFYEPLPLVIPVMGATEWAIESKWGDSRDNGKRSHEGIDIFASRGTVVLAPVDGVVTRVGWNTLGGRVIWIASRRTQHSFYLAHLSDIFICKGDTVSQGQQLGTVGNTGNARLTRPHLHFGIYTLDARRAINRTIIWKETRIGG